jgi:hypothetical protein
VHGPEAKPFGPTNTVGRLVAADAPFAEAEKLRTPIRAVAAQTRIGGAHLPVQRSAIGGSLTVASEGAPDNCRRGALFA